MKSSHNIKTIQELTAFVSTFWTQIDRGTWCEIIKQFFNTNTMGKPDKLERAIWLIDRYEFHLKQGTPQFMFDNGYIDFDIQRDLSNLPVWTTTTPKTSNY